MSNPLGSSFRALRLAIRVSPRQTCEHGLLYLEQSSICRGYWRGQLLLWTRSLLGFLRQPLATRWRSRLLLHVDLQLTRVSKQSTNPTLYRHWGGGCESGQRQLKALSWLLQAARPGGVLVARIARHGSTETTASYTVPALAPRRSSRHTPVGRRSACRRRIEWTSS
ncbi:hypothetical protein H257_09509 [Aphanomyces astaci]|uniref:Uncharacterized protein n=1 Tax=Aphanomyces astaci TaxID=112090 RepID=W4GBP5_APHAT|nr:hypothetical protein H257_09509 [Aphanomyces astaci]ETV76499.1 hypothetical protein H257_09509 [Aphanomyces astaci]|eukprot:XP_009834044.1 hypothetical protein H257_09509 [Aphanomyces astaci]